MDVWFMVFKRSVFEIQKQRTKSCKYPSYGYGEINQNVLKFAVWPKTPKPAEKTFRPNKKSTFSVFTTT